MANPLILGTARASSCCLFQERGDQLRQVEDVPAEMQPIAVHLLHQFRQDLKFPSGYCSIVNQQSLWQENFQCATFRK